MEGPKNPADAPDAQALVKAENQMATMSMNMTVRTTRLPIGYAPASAKSITERVCTMVNSPGKV